MSSVNRDVWAPAVRYHGGKWRLAPWIIQNIPSQPTCYVEPYGGGASVILRKRPSTIDVYNDLDGDVVNFFRVLRDQWQDLKSAIELTPYSREELALATEREESSHLERARRFYVRAWQGFSGPCCQGKPGWRYVRESHRNESPIRQWRRMEHMDAIVERLRGVYIEHDTALNVIARYDGPETLFYVDPPYLPATRSASSQRKAYVHEMTRDEHEALAGILNQVQGDVLISGYDSEDYDRWFADWAKSTRSARTQKAVERTECLWHKGSTRVSSQRLMV